MHRWEGSRTSEFKFYNSLAFGTTYVGPKGVEDSHMDLLCTSGNNPGHYDWLSMTLDLTWGTLVPKGSALLVLDVKLTFEFGGLIKGTEKLTISFPGAKVQNIYSSLVVGGQKDSYGYRTVRALISLNIHNLGKGSNRIVMLWHAIEEGLGAAKVVGIVGMGLMSTQLARSSLLDYDDLCLTEMEERVMDNSFEFID